MEQIVAKEGERTLTMVRITLTVPKTALAGVMLEISFARFMASMAAFNGERAPSRRSGRWDVVVMVEVVARKRCGAQAVRKDQNPHRDGRPFCDDAPRAHSHLMIRRELYCGQRIPSRMRLTDHPAGRCPSGASTLGARTRSHSRCSGRSLIELTSLGCSCLLTREREAS